MSMSWFELRTIPQAIKSYVIYGAICFSFGLYRGCEAGYDSGYRQAIQDVGIERIIEKEEKADYLRPRAILERETSPSLSTKYR